MPSLHSPKAEVLIVDDEVQTRELLSEFCQAQGYTVATAMTAGRHLPQLHADRASSAW